MRLSEPSGIDDRGCDATKCTVLNFFGEGLLQLKTLSLLLDEIYNLEVKRLSR